jgi:dipeptidase E
MAGEPFLKYPLPFIKDFLGSKPVKAVFIPFAAVSFPFDEFERLVKERFTEIGYELESIHNAENPVKKIEEAEAIVIGGGNTFHLLSKIYELKIIDAVRKRVAAGIPFIGWSAGSNVACPTICTTNDMPIIQPESFKAFNLVPFQINPHYIDANPAGHAGETREQRIMEFLVVNPDKYVVGLREGCMLKVENKSISLIGNRSLRVFKYGIEPKEYSTGDDLSFLL